MNHRDYLAGSRFRFPRRAPAWLCWLLLLAVTSGCDTTGDSNAKPNSVDRNSNSVLVRILPGDAPPLEFTVATEDKISALDALIRLNKEGKITFKHRGEGPSAFVQSINGLENQGAGGDNWVFLINDRLGNASSGIRYLQPGDRLTWRFGDYAPEVP